MEVTKRSRKGASSASVPTAIVKVDYETFAASNLSDNESKLLCCVCFKRFPFQGKIIQSCQGVINERVKDTNGNVVVSETRGHNHCEECHESEAYIGDKGDCTACFKAGRRFQGQFTTKAILTTKSLNFALMQINDQTHTQQKEYDALKKSEVQEKIDVDQQARDETRKKAAAKNREKKKQLQAFEKAFKDAQAHLDQVKARVEHPQQEDEPQALLTYNPDVEDGEEGLYEESMEPVADDEHEVMDIEPNEEVDKAEETMMEAKRALDNFKAGLSDEDDEEDDEDDEDEDTEDKDKKKDKKPRKERTAAQKAETLKKTRETWAEKALAKAKEAKETEEKLAAAEKFKKQNDALSKSLQRVVEQKEKDTEEFQATNATLMELQILKETWIRDNMELEQFQAMKAWVRDMKRNKPDQVQTLVQDYYAKKESKASKQAAKA